MLDDQTLADLQELAESAMQDAVQLTTQARALDAGGAPAPVPPSASATVPALLYLPKADLPRATVVRVGDTVVAGGVTYVVASAPPPGVYDVLRTIELALPAATPK